MLDFDDSPKFQSNNIFFPETFDQINLSPWKQGFSGQNHWIEKMDYVPQEKKPNNKFFSLKKLQPQREQTLKMKKCEQIPKTEIKYTPNEILKVRMFSPVYCNQVNLTYNLRKLSPGSHYENYSQGRKSLKPLAEKIQIINISNNIPNKKEQGKTLRFIKNISPSVKKTQISEISENPEYAMKFINQQIKKLNLKYQHNPLMIKIHTNREFNQNLKKQKEQNFQRYIDLNSDFFKNKSHKEINTIPILFD